MNSGGNLINTEKKSFIRDRLFFLKLLFAISFLLILTFYSINIGSIKVSATELFKGLFLEYDHRVETIFDLRFPRIFISLLSGAAFSISGVLLQCAFKNPLADPAILGISSGASFFALIITLFFPSLILLSPTFAIIGGIFSFILIQILSKGNDSKLRIILVGISIASLFTGLSKGISYAFSNGISSPNSMVEGIINMKTWDDFKILLPYVLVGIIISLVFSNKCNLLYLNDKTIRSIGVNSNLLRLTISILSAILASCATAIVGSISFLGLIVPHISRLFVGSDHKKLIPFCAIVGANVFLLADTLGRTLFFPNEIPASIVMAVVGGPFFIILLRRSIKNE